MWTAYPSTNVWQIKNSWEQYGSYFLGTLYNAQLLSCLLNTSVALLYSMVVTKYKRKLPEVASRKLIAYYHSKTDQTIPEQNVILSVENFAKIHIPLCHNIDVS